MKTEILLIAAFIATLSTITSTFAFGVQGSSYYPKDFVTGGGFLVWDSKSNYGFNAGYRPGNTKLIGHFNYFDHNLQMHVSSIKITSYWGISGTGIRIFNGTAKVTGPTIPDGKGTYNFQVTVWDKGEPGKQTDQFELSIPSIGDGYYISNSAPKGIKGGNIQLHN